MQSRAHSVSKILLDPRVIVGVCGAILSIVMHEALHIVMHWGEIENISLFPDHNAIVTIFFAPSMAYDLMIEELVAYIVTMVTLILTIMLVSDIHEAHDKRSVQQILFGKSSSGRGASTNSKKANDEMAELLGLKFSKRQVPTKNKK